ncbi:MAG TPA: sensor domain-containing diguanylate cyclase [Kofleriaceae bacterium]|nr:sensor domain-containing diguanylate cyclase [Kofleriaceae bacterium]
MAVTPSPERLLSVIELQNAIAAAGMNADEVMAIVVERAAALTGATGGVVAMVEGNDIVYRAVARPSTLQIGTRLASGQSAPSRCIAERAPIRIDDTSKDPRVDADTLARSGSGSLVCVPLLYGESAVGVLEVVSADKAKFSDEDVETLRLLAQTIAIALHRAYTYPKPKPDTEHDPLTGLGNKRAFDERMQAELTRNRRYGHSFSLALLDLAGLEAAIDRMGQASGDEALRMLAAILAKNTRAIDGCFRINAADFALVMPGTSAEGARIVAERCRAHIAEAKLLKGALTASFGVVGVQAPEETADSLFARAMAQVTADKQAQKRG